MIGRAPFENMRGISGRAGLIEHGDNVENRRAGKTIPATRVVPGAAPADGGLCARFGALVASKRVIWSNGGLSPLGPHPVLVFSPGARLRGCSTGNL